MPCSVRVSARTSPGAVFQAGNFHFVPVPGFTSQPSAGPFGPLEGLLTACLRRAFPLPPLPLAAAETHSRIASPGRKSSVLRTSDSRPYVVFLPARPAAASEGTLTVFLSSRENLRCAPISPAYVVFFPAGLRPSGRNTHGFPLQPGKSPLRCDFPGLRRGPPSPPSAAAEAPLTACLSRPESLRASHSGFRPYVVLSLCFPSGSYGRGLTV